MSLFPMLQGKTNGLKETLPLYRDCKWDYENDIPLISGGVPVQCTGLEAVKSWATNALHTVRRRYECFSFNYGNDMEHLIGRGYSPELTQSEAARYISECLLQSKYIKSAEVTNITFEDSILSATVKITTIYGEAIINV